MAYLFFDTSALSKHYHSESGSERVDALLADSANFCVISRFAIIEIHSVFAMKVRTGSLDLTSFDKLVRRFSTDARSRQLFKTLRFRPIHLNESARLLKTVGPAFPLRTLDALQITFAMQFAIRYSPVQVVCSDQRMNQVARHVGLGVIDPTLT